MSAVVPPERPRLKPSGWWYGAAAAIVGVSAAVAVVMVVAAIVGIFSTIDSYERVSAPGTGVITIDEPGTQRLYLEEFFPGGTGDVFYSLSHPEIDIRDPNGNRLDVNPSLVSETYTHNNYHGRSVGVVDAPVAGRYQVSVGEVPGTSAPARLAVGSSPFSGLPTRILYAVLIGVVGFVAGAVMASIVLIRRSRDKREKMPPRPPQPPPYPPTPPAWNPQGPQGPPGPPPPMAPPPPPPPPPQPPVPPQAPPVDPGQYPQPPTSWPTPPP